MVVFWDTVGQERFRSAVIKTIRFVNGIILVFDFTNRTSFKNLDIWLREIRDNFPDDTVIVLFGNKIDIEKEYWKVTIEEAKEYENKYNLILFKTSAKLNKGINGGFHYITNKAYSIVEKKTEEKNHIIIKPEKKIMQIVLVKKRIINKKINILNNIKLVTLN